MKAFKGEPPLSIKFRRKQIKSRPDLCRLMADIYVRETRKRFYFMLPGYYLPQELDKLDSNGRVIDPRDNSDKTLNATVNRIFLWQFYAVAGIEDLERSGVAVADFTKKDMEAAIKAALKRGGEL